MPPTVQLLFLVEVLQTASTQMLVLVHSLHAEGLVPLERIADPNGRELVLRILLLKEINKE